METTEQDRFVSDVVREIGRDVIAEIAPQELPLYRANSEAFLEQSRRRRSQPGAGKDDLLGFGSGEAVAFLTPAVLAVLIEVVSYLAAEAKKTFKEEGAGVVNDTVRRLFKGLRSGENAPEPPALSAEQLAQVRRIVLLQAGKLNLSSERSKILADAVIGRLAVQGVR
jgi:hypothetical protein